MIILLFYSKFNRNTEVRDNVEGLLQLEVSISFFNFSCDCYKSPNWTWAWYLKKKIDERKIILQFFAFSHKILLHSHKKLVFQCFCERRESFLGGTQNNENIFFPPISYFFSQHVPFRALQSACFQMMNCLNVLC